jgi:hypothetical protein
MTWLTGMEYMRHRWPRYVPFVVNTSLSFPHLWLIIWFAAILTRRMTLVEQELLILPEHLSSPPVFVGFVLLGLYIYVCLSFSTFFSSLCCTSFFELRILITPLVYSNFTYHNLAKRFPWHMYGIPYSLFLSAFASCSSIVPRPPVSVSFFYFILIFWINCQNVTKQMAVVTTNISLLLNGSCCYILRYN